MHASATESLLPYLKPGCRVLDIGSGSGYLTAVFAELVHPKTASDDTDNGGRVVGMEHIPALKELGEENYRGTVRGREMLERGRVRFVVGDGRKGWRGERGEDLEGWDAIHVGAAAEEVHDELVEQLRRPGR